MSTSTPIDHKRAHQRPWSKQDHTLSRAIDHCVVQIEAAERLGWYTVAGAFRHVLRTLEEAIP
jgi:hypothetical protein